MINERASDWAGVKRGIDSCKELIRCASAGLKTPPVIILQSDQQEFGLFQKDAHRIRASLVKGINLALELADRCPKATVEYRAASQRAAKLEAELEDMDTGQDPYLLGKFSRRIRLNTRLIPKSRPHVQWVTCLCLIRPCSYRYKRVPLRILQARSRLFRGLQPGA